MIKRISHVLWLYISYLSNSLGEKNTLQIMKDSWCKWYMINYIYFCTIVHSLGDFTTLNLINLQGPWRRDRYYPVTNEITGYLHLFDMYSWFSFRCPTFGVWKKTITSLSFIYQQLSVEVQGLKSNRANQIALKSEKLISNAVLVCKTVHIYLV